MVLTVHGDNDSGGSESGGVHYGQTVRGGGDGESVGVLYEQTVREGADGVGMGGTRYGQTGRGGRGGSGGDGGGDASAGSGVRRTGSGPLTTFAQSLFMLSSSPSSSELSPLSTPVDHSNSAITASGGGGGGNGGLPLDSGRQFGASQPTRAGGGTAPGAPLRTLSAPGFANRFLYPKITNSILKNLYLNFTS